MSLDAMKWAMKEAPIKKTKTAVRNRMVLTYLADRYNDDTRACYPSLDLIAKELDTSKTTIQRSVKELEDQGLIRRTNPQIVSHIPEYRRPTVWTLSLHMKREYEGSNVDTRSYVDIGGSYVDHPGVPTLKREGSNVDHLTQREPKLEPKGNPNAPQPPKGADGASAAEDEPESASKPKKKTRARHEYTPEFEAFWEMWPNHRGTSKFETSKKFTRALKAADSQTILDGAHRFATDPNLNVDYCPAPTTWLNNRRWEAAPLPPRNPNPSRQSSTNGFDDWWGNSTPDSSQLSWNSDIFNNGNIIEHQENHQ